MLNSVSVNNRTELNSKTVELSPTTVPKNL